ncbi:MAG: DHH family phosphoesterase [Thaumarchaeota archaeon]|nr:DHH family phosphoesterase [Nitrososphaerota archaeon]
MLEAEPRSLQYLKVEPSSSIGIICHRHADVDAYTAAFGLSELLMKLNAELKIKIYAPDGLGLLAKKVQDAIYAEVSEVFAPSEVKRFYVVDTGHASLLKEALDYLKASNAKVVFIDDHPPNDSTKEIALARIVDEKASSTAEVVYELFKEASIIPTPQTSFALLTGILADSQNLRLARLRTLGNVVELCKLGADLQEARELLWLPRERSEVIARLKGSQRLTIYKVGEWVLASTLIGSFHASVARALVELGADVAIAVGEHEEETRCCLRATQHFYKQTGLHLGTEIAAKVAEAHNGVGGGHPTAASLTAKISEEDLQNILRDEIAKRLGAKAAEVD